MKYFSSTQCVATGHPPTFEGGSIFFDDDMSNLSIAVNVASLTPGSHVPGGGGPGGGNFTSTGGSAKEQVLYHRS